MEYSKELSVFSGAVVLNGNIFNNITPYFVVNIVFIIILSAFVSFSLNCNANKQEK